MSERSSWSASRTGAVSSGSMASNRPPRSGPSRPCLGRPDLSYAGRARRRQTVTVGNQGEVVGLYVAREAGGPLGGRAEGKGLAGTGGGGDRNRGARGRRSAKSEDRRQVSR